MLVASVLVEWKSKVDFKSQVSTLLSQYRLDWTRLGINQAEFLANQVTMYDIMCVCVFDNLSDVWLLAKKN